MRAPGPTRRWPRRISPRRTSHRLARRRSAPWRWIPATRPRDAFSSGSNDSQHWYFCNGRGTIFSGLTSHPTDDGFHEIQLNGKQLVFLFMAATVVSVVIFLCGVLVGRGVRAERGGPDTALADLPLADQAMPTAGSASEGTDIRSAAPPAAVDDRPTLFERLE